jgi:hypothetical protein
MPDNPTPLENFLSEEIRKARRAIWENKCVLRELVSKQIGLKRGLTELWKLCREVKTRKK